VETRADLTAVEKIPLRIAGIRHFLRDCATSFKAVGSILYGVSGFSVNLFLLAALWPWG
jgi:hypothetical protein